MLVIYVLVALVGYGFYTVIRLKTEQWIEDSRMSRLSLKKNRQGSGETQRQQSPAVMQEVYEISEDESDESTTPDIIEDKEDEEDEVRIIDSKADVSSKFELSTDSLESGEDIASGSNAPPHSLRNSMFSWNQREKENSTNVNLSKERKKSESMYYNSDSSDDTFVSHKNGRYANGESEGANKKMKVSDYLQNSKGSTRRKRSELPVVGRQEELTIAGIKVKLPVKPYSCQIAVMNMLIQGCKQKQNCLLESPTGSGKTLALLCGVLAWQEHYSGELRKEQNKKLAGGDAGELGFDKGCAKSCAENSASWFEGEQLEDLNSSDDEKRKFRVPKVYYGTRTHKQIEQVIRELKKTIYRDKRMTILSSREHTCIQDTNRNKTELCNELLDSTKHIGCPYYNETNKKTISSFNALKIRGLGSAWDIEDLVDLGKDEQACPYFAARSLMDFAEIIFCPYNYLIDPDIRESMQIRLKDEVIILDEAHNIEDICRNVASMSFRQDHLVIIAHECDALAKKRPRDCETYNTLKNYILDLVKFLKQVGLDPIDSKSDNQSSPCWTGAELKEYFNLNNIGDARYPVVITAGSVALMDHNKAKEDSRNGSYVMPTISDNTKRILEHLMSMIQQIFSEKYVNDYRACVIESLEKDVKHVEDDTWHPSRKKMQHVRTLKLICMNPAVIFAPLSAAARSIILASGTLTPTASFQSELGTTFPHLLSANHVISKDQVYAACIPRGPSGVALKANYQNVNSWGFQDELGRLVTDVCESVPHGVLCFFSSYHVMNTQIDRWKKNSTWDRIASHKRIFMEPRNGADLAPIMRNYRLAIEDTANRPEGQVNGALLFAVFRGKVAEGIDFSDNEARCVLTIGIPYAVRKDPEVDMKYKYNDLNVSRGLLRGSDWYTIQAFRALNQALGRCVRHINDWGAVLLVDERFQMQHNITHLPKWIKAMRIEQRGYNLKEDLGDFVAKQKARETSLQ